MPACVAASAESLRRARRTSNDTLRDPAQAACALAAEVPAVIVEVQSQGVLH